MRKLLIVFMVLAGNYIYAQNSSNSDETPNKTFNNKLYIYRPSVLAGAIFKLEVFVNNVSVTKISNNSTFQYQIPDNIENLVIRVNGCGLYKNEGYKQTTIKPQKNKAYFIEVGWNYDINEPFYIKQSAYEQAASMFPGLVNPNTQNNVPEVAQNNSPANNSTESQNNNTAQSNQISNNSISLPSSSDVDSKIPENQDKKPYCFALIIGNEDYSSYQNGLSSEANVAYASNDAKTFKDYAEKTLRVPEDNTILLINARAIEMNRAIKKINLYAKNSNGKAEIFVYYAGHGFPDETTKEPYLVPVDVSGTDLQFAVKLKDLYNELTEFPTKKVTVFIDACFSGGARGQGLVAARGVKVKPKESLLNGNIVVFTSSSGDQSSLSYNEKNHGMFTYFLLKKLQETDGDVSYKDMADYLSEQVGLNSIRVNDKEQNPQTNVSPQIQNIWEKWDFSK